MLTQLTMHNVLTFTPSAFIEVLRDVTVKSGHHLRLQCKLSSLPTHPLTVTWTKNQHAIENYDNIRLVKDGVTYALDITQTETADTGHYRCSVTCGSRRITCSANVAVLGKSKSCQIRYPLLLNVKWHKLLQNVWEWTSSEMRKEHSSFLCPRRLNFDLRRVNLEHSRVHFDLSSVHFGLPRLCHGHALYFTSN